MRHLAPAAGVSTATICFWNPQHFLLAVGRFGSKFVRLQCALEFERCVDPDGLKGSLGDKVGEEVQKAMRSFDSNLHSLIRAICCAGIVAPSSTLCSSFVVLTSVGLCEAAVYVAGPHPLQSQGGLA